MPRTITSPCWSCLYVVKKWSISWKISGLTSYLFSEPFGISTMTFRDSAVPGSRSCQMFAGDIGCGLFVAVLLLVGAVGLRGLPGSNGLGGRCGNLGGRALRL